MCIFGASPMIGRPLLLNRVAASIMPGSTSLIGLKCFASAVVSGLTSPSLSVNGRLGINSFLSLVGLPETDDPAFSAAKLVTDHVKPSAHGRYGNVPDLAVIEAAIYGDNRLAPFDFARQIERQAALSGVFGAFLRVVFNLHIIL
jgi:hypothetical protein